MVDLRVHNGNMPQQIAVGLGFCHGNPPFVNHRIVFLLEFNKYGCVSIRHTIAAQAEFFFIERMLHAAARQKVILGVEVET